jgi:hypothetical protein
MLVIYPIRNWNKLIIKPIIIKELYQGLKPAPGGAGQLALRWFMGKNCSDNFIF